MLARLKDPDARDRMKKDIQDGHPRLVQPLHGRRRRLEPHARQRRLSPATSSIKGLTMDRIIAAKSAGRNPAPDPLDVLFDFLIEEDGSVRTIYAHTPRRT